MRKLSFAVALAVGLVGSSAQAQPVTTTIDFNTEIRDNVAELTFPGVTITAPWGQVFSTTFGPTPNGTRGIVGSAGSDFVPFRLSFSALVSFVSIDLGDFGSDEDFLFMRAFDTGNGLLTSATDVLPADFSGMRTLTVAAADIAFVEFGGLGVSGSSVYADNLVFTSESSAVPEPTSLAMLSAGFVGLLGAAARRRRTTTVA